MGALQVICLIAGLFGANGCASGDESGHVTIEAAGVSLGTRAGLWAPVSTDLSAIDTPDERPMADAPVALAPVPTLRPVARPDRAVAIVADPSDLPVLTVIAATASPSMLADLLPPDPAPLPAIRPALRPVAPEGVNPPPVLDVAANAPIFFPDAGVLAPATSLRPQPRDSWAVPVAQWDGEPNGPRWTAAVLSALRGPGAPLLDTVPRDIHAWCPGYESATPAQRAAFWTGLISTLAFHESTHEADAVGGGGQWFGLVQIAPGTARWRDCDAETSGELMDGAANLRCGIRIMSVTVPRDGVIAEGMRGVAADWGPFHSERKREEMRAWLREQTYCAPPAPQMRPVMRPAGLGEAAVALAQSDASSFGASSFGAVRGAEPDSDMAQLVLQPVQRPREP